MGTYTYLLRKKTVPVEINGCRHDAHFFSYSNRSADEEEPLFCSNESADMKRYRKTISRRFDAAEGVIKAPNFSGTVILCDTKEHPAGKAVYINVGKHYWYDTDKFPGTLVGWIADKPRGDKGFTLIEETEWKGGSRSAIGNEGFPVNVEKRNVIDPNTESGFREETRYILPDGSKTRSRDVAIIALREDAMGNHIEDSIRAASDHTL